jgi:tetratricopeptide (TPR) repeat protein
MHSGLRLTALALAVLLLNGCAAIHDDRRDRMEALRLEAHAMHAYHGDRDEEALALYLEIVELDSTRQRAWYRIGNLKARARDFRGAMGAYENALALDPEHAYARHNLALVHIRYGALLLEQGREAMEESDPDALVRSDEFLAFLLGSLIGTVDTAAESRDDERPDTDSGNSRDD